MRREYVVVAIVMLVLAGGVRPSMAFEKPDLSVNGPGDTHWQLSVSDRLRGEFASWFRAAPPNDNNRYDFLGNRFQLGIGVTRGPVAGFVQYQHTQLVNVPAGATGVGSTYFANTPGIFRSRDGSVRVGCRRRRSSETGD